MWVSMTFTAYICPLTVVLSFKYLVWVLSASDDDFPAVIRNLWRVHQKWLRMSRVLRWYGVDVRTLGMLYTAVVQVVLLYGSKTWDVSPRIRKMMGGFHHRLIRRITGQMTQRNGDGTCTYPPLEEAMAEVGM